MYILPPESGSAQCIVAESPWFPSFRLTGQCLLEGCRFRLSGSIFAPRWNLPYDEWENLISMHGYFKNFVTVDLKIVV